MLLAAVVLKLRYEYNYRKSVKGLIQFVAGIDLWELFKGVVEGIECRRRIEFQVVA